MADKVIPFSELNKTIELILDKYGAECAEVIEEEVNDVVDQAVKKLKSASPKNTGQYARGWKAKKYEGKFRVVGVIYNGKKPQLTHLLENGHATANGTDKVDAKKHIAPVDEWAEKELIARIERRLRV